MMTVGAFMMPFYISMGKIGCFTMSWTDLTPGRTNCPDFGYRAATMPPHDASLRWSEGGAVPTVCGTPSERW
jgi:hypothetical protein